ncbi:MAG TPA: TlpA disulfide reductase family protein [Acidobacteriota bacterium]|nr:TlpA disulfide reductase family protein [Acidobacteriota bacterium]
MSKPKRDWYFITLHVFLVLLAGLVGWLSYQNWQMQTQLNPPPPPQLEAGDEVQAVVAKAADGSEQMVDFRGQKDTLLFIFNTSCPVCKDNQKNWKDVYRRASERYNIVGISLDPREVTEPYIQEFEIPYKVVFPNAQEFATNFKISAIPTTIHIGKDGKVKHNTRGLLPEGYLDELSMR